MAMPEKINAAAMFDNLAHGVWDTVPEEGTPYIRADLVDDLRKALEDARERVEHWADVASRADRTRYDTSDDLAKIDAILARIDALKEK